MKKIFLLAAAVILFSPLSYADYDGYGRGGYGGGWGYREHHHRHYQPEVRYYEPPPVVYYQPSVRYYQQPPVQYYPQPQHYPQNSLRLSW